MILEVSLDLKIYFIFTVYSHCMKKILHLNFCCLFFLPEKSITLYSGHLFQEPQVSATDMFDYTRKIVGNQKEGRNICSHLFLSIFLQMIITVSWKIGVILSLTKQMGLIPLEEEYWRRVLKTYSLWVERNRLIVSFGQII